MSPAWLPSLFSLFVPRPCRLHRPSPLYYSSSVVTVLAYSPPPLLVTAPSLLVSAPPSQVRRCCFIRLLVSTRLIHYRCIRFATANSKCLVSHVISQQPRSTSYVPPPSTAPHGNGSDFGDAALGDTHAVATRAIASACKVQEATTGGRRGERATEEVVEERSAANRIASCQSQQPLERILREKIRIVQNDSGEDRRERIEEICTLSEDINRRIAVLEKNLA
ncbi:unnamed protein product [Nippostrongylus brasiliensis]|uniref:Uncharacterized protein n=1 Tax=Nippostrongylus brasiliensis TaxID=27835 RepID=A0A0N4YVM6_NIPBR|nr:unnamed protein product [Nippostrongylus brasiliensis]